MTASSASSDRHSLIDVIELLDLGAPVNAKSSSGITTLFAAVDAQWVEAAEELLDRGADPNESHPELRASIHGHTAMLELLRAHGAVPDPEFSDITTAYCAGVGGAVAFIDTLADPDLNRVARGAVKGGHISALEWAERRGAKFDAERLSIEAVTFGHAGLVEWLAARGLFRVSHAVYPSAPGAVPAALARSVKFVPDCIRKVVRLPYDGAALNALREAGYYVSREYLGWCRDVAAAEWVLAHAADTHPVSLCLPSPAVVRWLRGRTDVILISAWPDCFESHVLGVCPPHALGIHHR